MKNPFYSLSNIILSNQSQKEKKAVWHTIHILSKKEVCMTVIKKGKERKDLEIQCFRERRK